MEITSGYPRQTRGLSERKLSGALSALAIQGYRGKPRTKRERNTGMEILLAEVTLRTGAAHPRVTSK